MLVSEISTFQTLQKTAKGGPVPAGHSSISGTGRYKTGEHKASVYMLDEPREKYGFSGTGRVILGDSLAYRPGSALFEPRNFP